MKMPTKRSYKWTRSVNLPSNVFSVDEITEDKFTDIKSNLVGTIIFERKYNSCYVIDHRQKLVQLINIGSIYMVSNTEEVMHMTNELNQLRYVDVLMDEDARLVTVYDHIGMNAYTVRYGMLEAINAD
nr:MAG TPA: hypothetical protein [Caudoviricetes sp.]